MDLEDSWFVANSGAYGGAVYASGAVTGTGNVWCGNSAGSGMGGALYADTITSTNSVWARNEAASGGAIYLVGSGGPLMMTNNTVVANEATTGGGIYLQACGAYTTTLTNSIFAYTVAGDAVSSADASCSTSSTYNDWYANLSADAGGTFTFPAGGFGNVAVDPGFESFASTGDCATDNYALTAGSALVDAGTSSIVDVDGSRSDIGATGGPDADWADVDGDGWYAGWDCDDDDAAVHPGAAEVCDGLDQDCDDSVDDGVCGGSDTGGSETGIVDTGVTDTAETGDSADTATGPDTSETAETADSGDTSDSADSGDTSDSGDTAVVRGEEDECGCGTGMDRGGAMFGAGLIAVLGRRRCSSKRVRA